MHECTFCTACQLGYFKHDRDKGKLWHFEHGTDADGAASISFQFTRHVIVKMLIPPRDQGFQDADYQQVPHYSQTTDTPFIISLKN